MTAVEPRVYPLPMPEDDPRFTIGLILDVGRVLVEHGYPAVTSGADLVRLHSAMFRFLYARLGCVGGLGDD